MQGDDPGATTTGGDRARALAAVEALLRMLRHMRDCFPDDDLETVLVYLTVVSASAGAHLRDPDLLASMGHEPLPAQFLRPTSGRSVADSTGLPRETVRRRIDALVADGRLVRDGGGVRSAEGAMHIGRNEEFVRVLIQELVGAPARLARFETI